MRSLVEGSGRVLNVLSRGLKAAMKITAKALGSLCVTAKALRDECALTVTEAKRYNLIGKGEENKDYVRGIVCRTLVQDFSFCFK